MKLLLDTHIAIWAILDDPQLSEKARSLILDPDNTIYYSVVSVWEVFLKHEKNPANLEINASDFSDYCQSAGFFPLALYDKHVLTVKTLIRSETAKKHNDPFDKLLLAQAKDEKLSFLTHDSLIPDYSEKFIIPV